jgi:hypothetical protein
LVIALYLNAAVLVVIAFTLMSRPTAPSFLPAALAQNQQPIAGGAGLFVMPAQFSVNTWGCYLLDVDTQTLCAYQFYPGDKLLRLIAARNFRSDRRLSNFNTTPAPLEISDLLDKEQKANRVREQNNAPANPEAPKQE